MNDYLPKHQFIPTEKFELGHKYEVRLLFYHHPSRFSVYLHQKVGPLTEFQTELQHAMHKYRLPSSTTSYREGQPVAAQDHHQIWHRATIVQLLENGHEVRVYFVDVGLEETMALTNIRPLPHEFFRQVAFAISCRLHEIFPRNSTSQLSWSNNDPVHQEFQQLKGTSLICEVRRIDNKGVYEVQLGVPGRWIFSIDGPKRENVLSSRDRRFRNFSADEESRHSSAARSKVSVARAPFDSRTAELSNGSHRSARRRTVHRHSGEQRAGILRPFATARTGIRSAAKTFSESSEF